MDIRPPRIFPPCLQTILLLHETLWYVSFVATCIPMGGQAVGFIRYILDEAPPSTSFRDYPLLTLNLMDFLDERLAETRARMLCSIRFQSVTGICS